MDILSPNTVLTAQSFAYSNDNSLFNLKSSRSSKQGNHTQEKEQTLFRKQDGNAWVVIVREPFGGIKAYSEQEALKRKTLVLKGIPSYLPLENINKAKAILNGSKLLLSDYQMEVLPGLKGGMMREETHGEATAPAEYYCAVTHELMEDPYTNEIGNTYEKGVLEALLRTTKQDPLTRQPFSQIFPNRMLKAAIQTWKEQNLAVIKPGFPYMQSRNLTTAQRFLRLGQEFENENNFVEAEENYKRALKYTDDPKDYKQYAQFLNKLKPHEKAYKAYLELGKLYEKSNQLLEAKASYEAAKVLFPEKEELLENLVTICKRLHASGAAAGYLKELAGLYAKTNRLPQATKTYEAAFEISKERVLLETIASLYTQQGDSQKGIEVQKSLFELDIADNPNQFILYRRYGQFLKANGQVEAAATIKERFFQQVTQQTTLIAQQAILIESMQAQIELLKKPPLLTLDLSNKKDLTDVKFKSILSKTISNVGILNLASCDQLTDSSIQLLAQKFKGLTSFNLSGCKNITDKGLESLKGLTALTSLDLTYCSNITDKGLESLKGLIDLTSLSLNGSYINASKITDTGLESLKGLTALTSLDFSRCNKITDKGLEAIKGLTALTSLDLRYCSITDKGLEVIKGLIDLTSLSLNRCSNITDKGLEALKGLTALTSLGLQNCTNITDKGLEALKSLTALTSLDLYNCRNITDKGLEALKGLTALTSLDLHNCSKITDKGLEVIKGLTALTSLDLHNCSKITDKGLEVIKGLTGLTALGLGSCSNITDQGLESLKATLPKTHIIK
jgi:tetratricopeptide (TPR) repeat protein